MRVVVTGSGGQVGHDLVELCVRSGDECLAPGRNELDICDRDAVHAAIGDFQPDVVIHCAAWTAVDACESDPERAMVTNALAVRWMREATDRTGAHLVTLSTDYVFNGDLDRPYHEWDRPDPRSVYGRSKLAGEAEAGSDAAIVRTSWVCGLQGNNMVRTVMRLVDTHDRISFVDDQRGCPTFSADLAPVLRRLALERRTGVHHVTNQGAVSWFEFVQAIVAALGRDPAMVEPISTADLTPPRPAPRPANSVLDNLVLRQSGLGPLRDFHEPLAELVARLG
jgi:dTDP-4-dehydrorhamnose reductase